MFPMSDCKSADGTAGFPARLAFEDLLAVEKVADPNLCSRACQPAVQQHRASRPQRQPNLHTHREILDEAIVDLRLADRVARCHQWRRRDCTFEAVAPHAVLQCFADYRYMRAVSPASAPVLCDVLYTQYSKPPTTPHNGRGSCFTVCKRTTKSSCPHQDGGSHDHSHHPRCFE